MLPASAALPNTAIVLLDEMPDPCMCCRDLQVLEDVSAADLITFFEQTPADVHDLYDDFMKACQSMYQPATKYRRRSRSTRS